MAVIKQTRVFTRDNPCTKVDLFNCFKGEDQFVARAVVETRGEIGLNAPKYMVKNGFVRRYDSGNIEYYELTDEGRDWLIAGLKRHLELHPEDEGKVERPVFQLPNTRRSRRA